MNCKQFKDCLYEWTEGSLDKKKELLVQVHAQQCKSCSEEMERLKHQLSLLKKAPTYQPDERIWQAVKKAIHHEPACHILPFTRKIQTYSLKIITAAALLILCISAWLYQHKDPLNNENQIDAYLEEHAVYIAELSAEDRDTRSEEEYIFLMDEEILNKENIDFGTFIEEYFLS